MCVCALSKKVIFFIEIQMNVHSLDGTNGDRKEGQNIPNSFIHHSNEQNTSNAGPPTHKNTIKYSVLQKISVWTATYFKGDTFEKIPRICGDYVRLWQPFHLNCESFRSNKKYIPRNKDESGPKLQYLFERVVFVLVCDNTVIVHLWFHVVCAMRWSDAMENNVSKNTP